MEMVSKGTRTPGKLSEGKWIKRRKRSGEKRGSRALLRTRSRGSSHFSKRRFQVNGVPSVDGR
ncbi:hypothetical protein EYF80_059107 [Liparis tanakae]|uniref:Uncharacterized protein n=1 Tax=Liparis tanakae TaxID=230148 RepID=A0A4Z2EQ48_9TELE|nr:hypothetical protein EYF80_059107 [Liparis tanakae]